MAYDKPRDDHSAEKADYLKEPAPRTIPATSRNGFARPWPMRPRAAA